MTIDTNTVVSMTEANQNFSKVARVVDKYGQAVVFKNNAPRYLVIDFSKAEKLEDAATDDVIASANKMMDLYDEAFKELAK
ncbi:MAG: type II toxin-antitoxin system Phd/YefM family antitoxin [Oscillospiraceae bacterium]|nr:type II toxin-antitoxin system Phd/YefM family antitoxin [Oscillospiraceae bacterium]MBR3025614.1 type II toxin-antitoxin system Phd/YefM family antitoxin [Oscillospiraceae bacterium]MBR3537382.1 type II toxin-antitoxin system Phd/YefM family antitoxin [Oscillospiraceae bacterium]MBR6834918.1 type II toxin-antitoxin system Phd/YefM family antitoxin [Oscillospiraceae bacterium]